MAEKILQVEDLRISFKTNNGKVQAVRDISFDLYKGETFAIVGESGSGKSVTSRAIMGILAGNAIKEGGKILFDGKDLMKISEEEFQSIRGDKVAMIFQDPLSSLNPIMRVGEQLTEAMLLKNKAQRRESKRNLSAMLKALETHMNSAGVENVSADLDTFKKLSARHAALVKEYAHAKDAAEEGAALGESLKLRIQNNAIDNTFAADLSRFLKVALAAINPFVVRRDEQLVRDLVAKVKENTAKKSKNAEDYLGAAAPLGEAAAVLKNAWEREKADTFSLAYYLTFVEDKVPETGIKAMNELTGNAMDAGFMTAFREKAKKAVLHSMEETDKARQEAIRVLEAKLPVFEKEAPVESEAKAAAKELKAVVLNCLDPLEVTKDSETHTFDTSIDYAVDLYFGGFKKNAKEEVRYARDKKKYDSIVARGKTPDGEVIPASFVDLDAAKADMAETVQDMANHFKHQIEANKQADLDKRVDEIIEYLRRESEDSGYVLSKAIAKENAIKLMEGVGIDDPRRRYRQYPFEFSGGMRQRIVIAIALTANPDILICDEPTTALDVTIQAQILDLINELKKERNLSVIFITHDLGVVANMADRIGVMYAGKIVEYGTAQDVFYEPAHPYTWALLSSVPDLDTKEKLESIPGTPPNMIYPPKGDAFADRNKNALKIDFEEQPPMFQISDTHFAATWLLHKDAPKIEMPKVIEERIKRMKKTEEMA